jgi:C_GCAxxG_C_C family probable redox protein
MSKQEEALACFQENFSCSQAVFSTFASEMGLDRETALRVAGAFGGGMARMGETCGAVTGAFMLIGLKYGPIRADDKTAKDTTYRIVREFVEKFKERNQSIVCRELLGVHPGTPEGMQAFKEKDLKNTICAKLVRDAAEIIEEILGK